MTIRRFEQLARASPFTVEQIEPTPIRELRWLHGRWTREWTSNGGGGIAEALSECRFLRFVVRVN
jgi:hypothetical protein